MSSFLLAWHRAGDAVPASVVARAAAHRAVGAGGAVRARIDGAVGAWIWEGAWAPGAESALPISDDGWCLAGTLRLDARPALAARLRALGHEAPESDDAWLAMAAFHAWGEDAAAHWLGDYAVAALAPTRDRLIVARGVTGVRSCFILQRGPLVAVSDDLALLVRLAGGRGTPVEEAVAEYLRHGHLVTPELTFHRDIVRVPAARTVVIDRDGRVRTRAHWSFPDPPTLHDVAPDELIARFRAALGAAVADRLRGPRASILLSGGLDSPALAVEARRQAPAVALHAMTASWERLLDDPEPPLAAAVATRVGVPQTLHRFAADEGLPGSLRCATPEPLPDSEPALWRAQAARLAALAPVSLNGEDGDAILTPPTLPELILRDGPSRTFAAWRAFRAATGRRPWVGLGRAVRQSVGRDEAEPAPRWLRDEAARRGVGRDMAPPRHRARRSAVAKLTRSTWDATCWLDDPVMSGADVVVLLPFMDPRVLEVAFALPAIPWLQRKEILRRAYRDALPEPVIVRDKSPVRGYYEARLRAWRAAGAPAPLEGQVDAWVDVARWRETLARSTDADEVYAAWRVVELSRWLAQPED